MILPDHELKKLGSALISPFKPEAIQPASIDLTLDDLFVNLTGGPPIDLGDVSNTVLPGDYEQTVAPQGYRISPGEFVLGSTVEAVMVPSDLVGVVEGKSSLGRLGVMVHSTAGFIDPGFSGKITLEFYNLNSRTLILRPGLKICQITFTRLESPAKRPYGSLGLGSRYQGQATTTTSRY